MPKPKLPDKNFEWFPGLAYVVGLLVTDGNLSKNGRTITIRSIDLDLLETVKVILNLNNKIGGQRNGPPFVYTLQFGSVQFYNWLERIGIHPRKTYNIGEIDIPDEYFIDFLRGHLDGDGTITHYIDRNNSYKGRVYRNNRLFVRFISASEQHIIWLHQKIIRLTGLKGALIKNKPFTINRVPIWEIKFAKKESIRLLQQIYYKRDLPCLKRKFEQANMVLALMKFEKRKVYSKINEQDKYLIQFVQSS